MPEFNSFAPVIETGGSATATAGPVSGAVSGKLGAALSPEANHATAAIVLLALVLLWALWKSKFRFSVTVG